MRFPLLFFFCISNTLLHGQFVHESNVIIPLSSLENNYGVATADEEGIVLYHEVVSHQSYNKRKWEVRVLDNSLNSKWVSFFESAMNFVISDVKYHSGYFYLCFKDINVPLKSVLFVRFPLSENKFEFFQINEFLPQQINGFEILGNSIFLIGNDSQKPAILKFSFGDPRPFVLQGLFNNKNYFLKSSVNPDLGFIQIITRMKKKGMPSMILLKQFAEDGSTIRDLRIESSKGYQMIDALGATDKEGNTIVVGTYSYKRSSYSNGIFTTIFKEEEQNDLYYYDYSNLYNYHNFLEDEQEISKAQKKLREGNLKINCLPQQLKAVGDQMLFIGEVYQKSKYGVYYPEYTHALVLSVGDLGKLIWDNSISLNNGTSHSTSQKTLVNPFNDAVMISYSDGFSMHHKIMDGKNDLTGNESFMIGEFNKNFTLEGSGSEQYASVVSWYQNTFLIFGVKSFGSTEFNQKRFFYLDKLSVNSGPNQ